jgi:hypothetical protein
MVPKAEMVALLEWSKAKLAITDRSMSITRGGL